MAATPPEYRLDCSKPIDRPGGHRFEPTVLVNVDHDLLVMREESFGPIVGIQKVASDDEAVRLMNDTDDGLTAGVNSMDEARAKTILAQVHVGSVYWNCYDRVSPRLPCSGVAHSRVGLALSTYSIEAFTRPKAWPGYFIDGRPRFAKRSGCDGEGR